MFKDFDSQHGHPQSATSSPSPVIVGQFNKISSLPDTSATSKSPASHLKLVASKSIKKARNASPLKGLAFTALSAPVYKSAPTKDSSFTAEVRKRSPYDFAMVARDPFHCLHCELPLKFERSEGVLALVCQFPIICDEELVDFINGDENLLGMTLITFQMQILKNLFRFCRAHKVQNLIIKATEDQFAGLGIYEEFIKYVDKIPTKQGVDVEITIPLHSKSMEHCNEFMDNMVAQFRKTLWKEQSKNSAIRNYLKTNVCMSVVM
jgi:hypothetical protein